MVSIPVGFSDALRPDTQEGPECATLLFQSLLGFLMRCDISAAGVWTAIGFQSLLGFLMRCDLIVALLDPIVFAKFQSLLGFLMRCDSPVVWFVPPPAVSFNPCWVF